MPQTPSKTPPNKAGPLPEAGAPAQRDGDDGAVLVEGTDYLIEGGLFVLTADYLKRRGFCCQNNCRHCPYS
jgi:hypothetical protein